uniref:Uncharacterized protein n=1 Tax=Cacopsylla melanoneura TaxID=428564 RepID=A0A8D8ZCH3_9HEMI
MGSARKNVKGVVFADKQISDVSIEAVSRKSKTRYTVITLHKSRSQPNIHQSFNDEQSEIGVKRSASNAETLSNDTYNAPELVEFDDAASNHTDMSDFIKYVRNSSAQEDIKSCSYQIVEFLNEFEASQETGGNGAVIPWEKHVEIKVLFDILVGQIHDQMKDINEELSKF